MRKRHAILAAATALLAATATAQAGGIEIGMLDCVVEKGGRLVEIRSNRFVTCTYTPFGHAGAPELYNGTVEKLGLDVGGTGYRLMQWKVVAIGSNAYEPGSLAGSYVGASAEATIAVGVGAHVLGGGSDESFLLQPVSVQEQAGLNAAVSVTRFTLDPA
jgi:hypothetical protein